MPEESITSLLIHPLGPALFVTATAGARRIIDVGA
jgi:hypothetical protein